MLHTKRNAAVEIDALGKSYGPTVALESVTLSLRPGESTRFW